MKNHKLEAVMKKSQLSPIWSVAIALTILAGCNPDIDIEAPESEFQSGGSLAGDGDDTFTMMDGNAMDGMSSDAFCRSASDCTHPTPACFILPGSSEGECVACTESTFCPDDTPFCLADNRCGAESDGTCRIGSGDDFDNGDCESIDYPYCLQITDDGLGLCVQCVTDEQCNGRLDICATTIGQCVATEDENYCDGDEQCGLIRRCDEMQSCVAL